MLLPRLVRVKYARVQHTVELQRHIVSCDGTLAWDLECSFLQTLHIRYPVEKRYQYGETRLQYAVEFAHALHNPCCLLRDESYDGIRWWPFMRLEI